MHNFVLCIVIHTRHSQMSEFQSERANHKQPEPRTKVTGRVNAPLPVRDSRSVFGFLFALPFRRVKIWFDKDMGDCESSR
jgi:hypothetical protein